MPHISVKMLKGRTEEQKRNLAEALAKTLTEQLRCSSQHVTICIVDYTPVEWQEVFKREVTDKPAEKIYKKPEYDPKDLL